MKTFLSHLLWSESDLDSHLYVVYMCICWMLHSNQSSRMPAGRANHRLYEILSPWWSDSFCAGRLSCDQKSGIHFTKGSESCIEGGWLFQLVYYLLGTTTKLSKLFRVLRLWNLQIYYKHIIIKNIVHSIYKKAEKQVNKNVKRCKDGMPKCMQTRYKSEYKSEYKALSLHLFHTRVVCKIIYSTL